MLCHMGLEDWRRWWPVYAVAEDGALLLPRDEHGGQVDVVLGIRASGMPAVQVGDQVAACSVPLATVGSALWSEVIAEAMRMGVSCDHGGIAGGVSQPATVERPDRGWLVVRTPLG